MKPWRTRSLLILMAVMLALAGIGLLRAGQGASRPGAATAEATIFSSGSDYDVGALERLSH